MLDDAFLSPPAETVRAPAAPGRVAVEAFLSRLVAARLAALVEDGVAWDADVVVGVEDDLDPCRGPPFV